VGGGCAWCARLEGLLAQCTTASLACRQERSSSSNGSSWCLYRQRQEQPCMPPITTSDACCWSTANTFPPQHLPSPHLTAAASILLLCSRPTPAAAPWRHPVAAAVG
jgi:hypothetical protein